MNKSSAYIYVHIIYHVLQDLETSYTERSRLMFNIEAFQQHEIKSSQ